ncbi:RBR-type E3 ubiquitin transferase [Saccharomycopsis crataegensis]|uniref:RBR-type E3 ubiquitin transferase n=1 Tax=Saccharomycopsis crataegensis TaxID=43959 RepID=A0AAV5QP07_9ASCO|nr:RBR-type E3 ubiquitin transferase [Saccharomycopsis crataegensis]
MTDNDDIRLQELSSLEAIYEELIINYDTFEGSIDLVIHPEIPVTITDDEKLSDIIEYLPSLKFKFKLVEGYPYEKSPDIQILDSVRWIPESKICRLIEQLEQIYLDTQDMCIFSMIDHINEESNSIFGLSNRLHIKDPVIYRKMLCWNRISCQKQLQENTYICEICQESKKGIDCSFVPSSCGHVFCQRCLREYMINAIENNDSHGIQCPHYECVKRSQQHNILKKYSRGNVYHKYRDDIKIKDIKSILRKILIPEFTIEYIAAVVQDDQMIKKYRDLSYTKKIDQMEHSFTGNTSQCPRLSCRRFFVINESQLINKIDEDEEDDDIKAYSINYRIIAGLLICPFCKYAYCSQCLHSWHGENNECLSVIDDAIPESILEQICDAAENSEIFRRLEEFWSIDRLKKSVREYKYEKEFRAFLKSDEGKDFTRCRGCKTIIEREGGCNKMKCTQCQTSFCNLCGVLLGEKPYEHFNDFLSTCYGKLMDGIIDDE